MSDILQQAAEVAAQREQSYRDPACYRKALDEGDFDTLITFYELAMTDEDMAVMIERVDAQFEAEIPPEALAKARQVVTDVLDKHRSGEL